MSEETQNPLQTAPYEGVLTKAFDKLTSEVFIFLLAYMILIIGLAVFGERLANTLKTLLYIIPVLGVAAYVWLTQKTIRNEANKSGIDVGAGVVTDSARVIGVQGAKSGDPIPENVKVRTAMARGKAMVGGVVYGSDEPANNSANYLMELFMKLDADHQGELIADAQKLLRKQGTQK